MQNHTINARCTVNLNHPKKSSEKEKLHKAKKDCLNHVHTDQMVLRTVRREAGPCERQPKVLKTKLAQGGPSGLSHNCRNFFFKGSSRGAIRLESTQIRWFS
jgi:hypothetical protein